MGDAVRPFLILPAGMPAAARRQGGGGSRHASPKKRRLVELLGPSFAELQRALEAKLATLAASPAGAAPEQVVVFETLAASASPLVAALRATPTLAWLADGELDEVEPDSDYHKSDKPTEQITSRLFLVMANHEALAQVVSLWKAWSASGRVRLPEKHAHWGKAFRCLKDVRVWGPADRLRETGLAEHWERRKATGQAESVPVEIELWNRSSTQRAAAVARVGLQVRQVGGSILAETVIEAIAYHAVLAQLPAAAVEALLTDPTVELIKSDDIHILRPIPQQPRAPNFAEGEEASPLEPAPAPATAEAAGAPVVAILDGLPLQNHQLLRGRLIIDDPDGWEASYPASSRRHGTAMASLVIHGDRSAPGPQPAHPIYVRPIIRPCLELWSQQEEAPQDEIWIDVIHRAVVRIVGSAREPAAGGSVRVINLSIGDLFRPFLREASPLARLLDWLAWTHDLLFVVSAGNHAGAIAIESGDEAQDVRVFRAILAEHRHRRLLAPAEAINALTVGSANADAGGPFAPRHPDEVDLVTNPALPSPISALGRGLRRSVKPDLLASGGRVVFQRRVNETGTHVLSFDRARTGPGQRVASPGAWPDQDREEFTFGTSNAAAITTRAAWQVLDALSKLRATATGQSLAGVSDALLVKALLVHSASWDPGARDTLERVLRSPLNAPRQLRDQLSAFLGFGLLRADRAVACSDRRATIVGGGTVGIGKAIEHFVPVPKSLNAFTGSRQVIVTLAWFSPVAPRDRRYRATALDVVVDDAARARLGIAATEADGNAAKRGTLQHVVLSGEGSAARAGADDRLRLTVNAVADAEFAGAGPDVPLVVPYALAVSIEVSEDSRISVYDEIKVRLQARVRART